MLKNNNLLSIFFILFSFFSFSGCASKQLTISNLTSCQYNQVLIKITGEKESEYCVAVADDSFEQTRGLMFVESMPDDEGMLFVFTNEDYLSFWMKNTLIPLDILFFDKSGKMVDMKNDFQPCQSSLNCQSYQSVQPAKYVLEVNSDQFSGEEKDLRLAADDLIK